MEELLLQIENLKVSFHTDEGVNPILMFNVHFEKRRGMAIDDMIECSRQRANSSSLSPDYSCGVLTPILQISKYSGRHGVAIFQPIYPANDPDTVRCYLLAFVVGVVLLMLCGKKQLGCETEKGVPIGKWAFQEEKAFLV